MGTRAENEAEWIGTLVLPDEWYLDTHGDGVARCCVAVDRLAKALQESEDYGYKAAMRDVFHFISPKFYSTPKSVPTPEES